MATSRKVFVNLPVRSLDRSVEFFRKLGFEFNAKFTNEQAACMVLSDDGYVMLLTDTMFKTFTKRDLCDGSHTETITALSCDSRAEVDSLTEQAVAAGATVAFDPIDYGSMYSRSFYDLDGHHWEVLWMDMEAAMEGCSGPTAAA